MSISSVVTRGFGSWGNVNDVVTRGYSIAAVAIPPDRPFIPLSVHSTVYAKSVHRTNVAQVVKDSGVKKIVK